MAADIVERRLAAILAADVAGYSRLMAANDEGTLERFNSHRREFLEPKIAEHRGRIVNWAGDGVLIEFVSAVDATRCAIEVQRGMAERNEHRAHDAGGIEPGVGIHFFRLGVVGELVRQHQRPYFEAAFQQAFMGEEMQDVGTEAAY